MLKAHAHTASLGVILKRLLPELFVGLSLLVFCALKVTALGFRLGDGNSYAYMANVFAHGVLPYRDFAFGDPPLLLLVLAVSALITKNSLVGLLFLPMILEASTALVLYILLKKWNNPFALLAPALYLSSLIILRTSDHFNGGQLVVFLCAAGLLFWENDHSQLSGVLWGLACMTKLYTMPAVAGFALALTIAGQHKKIVRFFMGFILASILILGPFLLLTPTQTFREVIVFHFQRLATGSNGPIIQLFFRDAWLLFALAIGGTLVEAKKNLRLVLPLVGTLGLFFFYQDIYYLYLANAVWYLILLALSFLAFWWKNPKARLTAVLAFIGILIVWGISTHTYFTKYKDQNRFASAKTVASFLASQRDKLDLYGDAELTSLLALLTGKKIFAYAIDTNINLFSSGIFDRDAISTHAARQGIFLIARARPTERGILLINASNYFDPSVLGTCKRLQNFWISAAEDSDIVSVYRCKLPDYPRSG